MRCLEHYRLAVFARLILQTGVGKRREIFVEICLIVDLVERHPVFHFVLVAFKRHRCETHKEIDQLAITPSAVFRDQMIGHLKVRKGNHRLNAVFPAFVEQIVIELQTGFIGFQFITIWEEACPGN
ncbi:hypothetical protein D3C78_1213420 [compost metagenome]